MYTYLVSLWKKALASTSATPGHTKHFHFFNVNKDRKDVPPFCFVDVPGLGTHVKYTKVKINSSIYFVDW